MVYENAYESGEQKSIPAVLVYLRSNEQILMVCRSKKPGDIHEGRFNGLGGKHEPRESPWQAAAREVGEECGLVLPQGRYEWLGTLQFPNFKPLKSEDWIVSVLVTDVTVEERSRVWSTGPEGDLSWVSESALLGLRLWEGDRHFLPLVCARTPFVGCFWYNEGKLTNHRLQTMKYI